MPVMVSLWPQRLIQYNLALIYFTTFWHKFQGGSHWRDLTATYYPAHLAEFHRFPVPEFVNLPPFIYFSTFATLAIELSLGTIVFYKPARKWVLGAGLLMHGYIEYSMNIPLFGPFICCFYLCFYSGEEIAGFFKRLGSRLARFKTVLVMPKGEELRPSALATFEALDPLGLVSVTPGSEPVVLGAKSAWKRSFGAWTFGWVPGLYQKLVQRGLSPAKVPTPKQVAVGAGRRK